MSSSITVKQNPFQRSNPFQSQQSHFVPSTPSYIPFQQQHHRSYEPTHDSFVHKQHHFAKPADQSWKFHQDNCKKVNVFNSQSYSRVGQKLLGDKNSFQKDLVMSNVGRKVNNNSGQQVNVDRLDKIENPFARKYLLGGGKLVESQVSYGYSGQNENSYVRHKTEYDNYTSSKLTEYDNYRYNNMSSTPVPTTPQPYYHNPIISIVASHSNLQSSLHYKNDQYGSRKSIERDDHYNRANGSFSNIPNPVGQSRYSIERQKQRHYQNNYNNQHVGSSQNIYQQSSNKYLSLSRAQRDDGAKGSMKNLDRDSGVKVKFDDSDDERDGGNKYYERNSEERAPRFGSGKNIPQLKGPEVIEIHGMKFYRQSVKCF